MQTIVAEEAFDVTIGIRHVQPTDVDDIVRIHKQAFDGFFLTQLGDRFLRLYYRTVLQFDGGILLLAANEREVPLGFVAGFMDAGEFYRRLKKQRPAIAAAIVLPLLRRPWLLRRLFASASLAGDRVTQPDIGDKAELSSIAVTASGRGRGVGRRLLASFCDEVARRGARAVVLTTDAVDNDAVNDFYGAANFLQTRQFETTAGRKMNEYELALHDLRGADAEPGPKATRG